jgi:HEAT repeat protein
MVAIGGPGAVQALVERVEDPSENAKVREEAVRALGTIGPPAAAAIPSLTAAAEKGDLTALQALRKIGAEAVSPILVRLVGDRAQGHWMRTLYANEIREVGPAAAAAIPVLVEALHDTGRGIEGVQKAELRRAAASALAKLGPEGVAALTAALRDPQRDVRQDAAYGLMGIGPEATEAIPALVAALRDDEVSSTVKWAVSNFKGLAVPFLMRTLEEPGGGPYMAAATLLSIGAPAVPALVGALESPSLPARRKAAWILTQIGSVPEDELPAVIAAMNDSSQDEEVRAAIPEILRRTPGSTAFDALVGGLASDSGAVRKRAAEQIGEIGPAAADAVPHLQKLLGDPAAGWSAGRALVHVGGAALPALESVLRDSPDPGARALALDAYGSVERDPRKKLRVVTAASKEPSEEVRVMAARQLGTLGPQAGDAVPPLVELLHDPSPAVRFEACQALGGLGTTARGAMPGLRATLAGDADPNVRSGAARALATMGRYAADNVPALVAALEDSSGTVRCSVAQALGWMGRAAAAAAPALEEARTKDDEGWRCIDGALRDIRGQRP